MIGIFDSGIGGVTVLKELIKELPHYHYVYYSDSLHNPYGDKSLEELFLFTKKIVNYLVNQGCKIIVIACNTASALCKDYLRKEFSIPILAIEPAYKLVYDSNYKGKTLIMATRGTIESDAFLDLYHLYDNHQTYLITCSGLADLIEQNKKEEIKKYLQVHLKDYPNIENVVLGCTHYPLIKEEIKKVLGDVSFFDGSVGVAKHLKQIIYETGLSEEKTQIDFVDSSGKEEKKKRFFDILNQ